MSDIEFVMMPLSVIEENPDNPRADLGDLSELADSIRAVGILQPVTVLPSANGDTCKLVSGHRRVAAARLAGLTEVPAVVRRLDDDDVLPVALIENLHRQDLTAIDEAAAYARLRDEEGWSVQRIAEAVHRSDALVYQKLRLLDLPAEVQEKIRSGEVAWTDAYNSMLRSRQPSFKSRGEKPPLSTVRFRSDSLFDFARELRAQADDDPYADRAEIHRRVADHFEEAGRLLKQAASLRDPMTCTVCGESLMTHPITKRCAG